jgi:L-seryl-tRNA(Ser) seleniumtransferase
LIVGRSSYVDVCRRHQLFRALRPGRLVYTALEATLRLYADGTACAKEKIPTLRQLFEPHDVLRKRASRLVRMMKPSSAVTCAIVPCQSQAGSGSLPTLTLPSWGAHVRFLGMIPMDVLRELRGGSPPIIARSLENGVVFDVRTLDNDELGVVARRVREIADVRAADRRAPSAVMASDDGSLIV